MKPSVQQRTSKRTLEVAAALRQAQAAAAQKRGKFDFRPMLAEACLQKLVQQIQIIHK